MPKSSQNSVENKLKLQLKSKDEQLKLLQKISATISYNLDIESVLEEIVELVSTTMKADSCLIYLAEEEQLILKASKIPHPKMINKVAMKFGEGITGWVAKHKELVVIEAMAYQDKRFKGVPNLSEDKWENFISMPITYRKKVVGVINVQNRKKRKYDEDQIRLLETITSQIGGAITNAKLLSETQTLKEALETRKLVERAKGLLMKQHALSEDEAYKVIQKKAMDAKKPMREVAEAMVLALEI